MRGDLQKIDGFHRGIVVKHCNSGRCKVWIPGIYPNEFREKPEFLPDAE